MEISHLQSDSQLTLPPTLDPLTPISKKKGILHKKKKIPERLKLLQNIALKHVINIGDICYMNSDALRNPDSSSQSLITSVYHYNMISKISINKTVVNLELKRNYQDFLPPQYFIERLRSFGDKQMANVAQSLEKIHYQFSMIKETCPTKVTPFNKQKEEVMLKNFIASREGKKYFLFFSEISPQKITMKNIMFSVPLLEALGYDVDTMSAEFVKYKHVFFEVFTSKNYGYFLEECYQKFFQIQAEVMQKPDMDEEERRKISELIYQEEVVRKIPDRNCEYEEIIPAKVAWFSPHPSICCFEILDINESEVQKKVKKIKLNELEGENQEDDLRMLEKTSAQYSIMEDRLLELRQSGQKTEATIQKKTESIKQFESTSEEKMTV